MVRIHHAFEVAVPVPKVWARITDLERFGVLLPHVSSVRAKSDGNTHVWNVSGSLGPVSKSFSLEVGWRDMSPPTRATFAGDGDGVKISGTLALAEISSLITRIEVELEISPGGGIIGAVVNHIVKTNLANDIRESEARIRDYVERP